MAKQMVFGLGLVGCGAFGRFCVKAYHELAGVRLVAVADTVRPAADAFAREFGVEAHYDARKLIQRADVDIVHIATPPSTHYKLAMQCAAAGKHVLCEKPLATTVADGRKMIRAAAGARTIMPVNFIMWYNRVVRTVGEIILRRGSGRAYFRPPDQLRRGYESAADALVPGPPRVGRHFRRALGALL